jgi:predicted molibdopterin-dependent oxidoreductase YjgC
VQQVRRAVPPRAGLEGWEVIARLAGKMGLRFKMKYDSASQVMEEIRRVAPIYRDVEVGSQGPEAIWDATQSPMKPVAVNGAETAPFVTPVATRAFDHLEVRFDAWFDGLFAAR